MRSARPIWRIWLLQVVSRAFAREALNTGNSSAARSAMIAITTISSMRVNARRAARRELGRIISLFFDARGALEGFGDAAAAAGTPARLRWLVVAVGQAVVDDL